MARCKRLVSGKSPIGFKCAATSGTCPRNTWRPGVQAWTEAATSTQTTATATLRASLVSWMRRCAIVSGKMLEARMLRSVTTNFDYACNYNSWGVRMQNLLHRALDERAGAAYIVAG